MCCVTIYDLIVSIIALDFMFQKPEVMLSDFKVYNLADFLFLFITFEE